ncbi:MAG: hypothetical protein CMH30_05890, partial [Micavibrio sp.]|nr:hypothetical protein [Micavibrio sp.]
EPSPSQALSVNGSARLTQYLFLEDYAGGDSKTAGIFSYNDLLYFRRHTSGTDAYEADLMSLSLLNGNLSTTGEFISTNSNQFRMVQGNYGVFFRNDGTNTYLLLTTSGDQYGGWNSLRPFSINNSSGDVYIGGNAMAVRHGGNVEIGNSLVFTSDRKEKESIEPLHDSLKTLSHLQGVSYVWKNKTKDQALQYGLIAQEVEKTYPNLISYNKETDIKSVNYIGLIAPMIEAIKELKAENEALKTRLDKLETEGTNIEQ